ncbi:MAG TPA: hypothetical protein VID27_07655 [Blastocatellia bacterium]|jgi:hypothetical protein
MQEPKKIVPSGVTIEWTPQKKILAAAAAIFVAFLLGYTPSCLVARNAQSRLAAAERKIRMSDLLAQIGMSSYEANRNNFANASQFSTEFFNGLMKLIEETSDEETKKKLQTMLALRDEITTNLAQADQTIKPKLAQMYADFYQLTRNNPAAD